MPNKNRKKLKIYKIFYDTEVIQNCSDYEIVSSETEPYPYYHRLANYTAADSDTTYIAGVVKSVDKFLTENFHDISGLFIKLDIEAVILTAVLSKFSEKDKLTFKYPSFESVFLCNHKYYQRTKEKTPINFSYIDVDNDQLTDGKTLDFPFFFKAPELQMSVHQYVVKDSVQLEHLIKLLRAELPKYDADTKYINNNFLNLEKYPLATKNLMVCEQVMNNCLQLNWEGWADEQGNIFTYGFTDEILADYGIFSDFIMPSILPQAVLDKADQICKDILKSVSFTSSFANIELWIDRTDNMNIHIIEVNPRSAFSYDHQYRTSYCGADLYKSIIRLSMGEDIGVIPDMNTNFTGLYSCQSVFATRCNGKISELLNFDKIEEEKEEHKDYRFHFLFTDRQFEIVDNCQSGARVLMRVFYAKPSYEEALIESLRLKKLFLSKDTYFIQP